MSWKSTCLFISPSVSTERHRRKKLLKEIEQKSDKITPLINISWEKYVWWLCKDFFVWKKWTNLFETLWKKSLKFLVFCSIRWPSSIPEATKYFDVKLWTIMFFSRNLLLKNIFNKNFYVEQYIMIPWIIESFYKYFVWNVPSIFYVKHTKTRWTFEEI